jgi:hypothetical protein
MPAVGSLKKAEKIFRYRLHNTCSVAAIYWLFGEPRRLLSYERPKRTQWTAKTKRRPSSRQKCDKPIRRIVCLLEGLELYERRL